MRVIIIIISSYIVISSHHVLFCRLPKMNTPDIPKATNQDIQNEVQDFSMPSKKQTNPSSSKGKLDDMLNKLKKRNNCVSILPHIN